MYLSFVSGFGFVRFWFVQIKMLIQHKIAQANNNWKKKNQLCIYLQIWTLIQHKRHLFGPPWIYFRMINYFMILVYGIRFPRGCNFEIRRYGFLQNKITFSRKFFLIRWDTIPTNFYVISAWKMHFSLNIIFELKDRNYFYKRFKALISFCSNRRYMNHELFS
jgi:hypothetical protein